MATVVNDAKQWVCATSEPFGRADNADTVRKITAGQQQKDFEKALRKEVTHKERYN